MGLADGEAWEKAYGKYDKPAVAGNRREQGFTLCFSSCARTCYPSGCILAGKDKRHVSRLAEATERLTEQVHE